MLPSLLPSAQAKEAKCERVRARKKELPHEFPQLRGARDLINQVRLWSLAEEKVYCEM